MSEKNHANQSSDIDRRQWMTSAATLAAGVAAAPFVSTDLDATEQATSAVKSTTSRVVSAPSNGNIVEIDCGKIRGFSRNGILAFKGIPYAATTAGTGRYVAPAKPASWSGVRSCMALGFACPQPFHVPEGRRAGWTHDEEAFMFDWDDGQPGEDCLRVNVWTPSTADTTKRPVLVWIHGGGYTSGSSNELRMYDGESLARRGNVVVVSLNHRLGPLGYINLQDYGEKWSNAVNVGQLDQIAALEWVRDNIGRFGGDPSKVLVFGQSGGGGKISTLMGMPAAKGLFHRAVIQSGSSLRQITPDRSASLAAATLQELGISKATIEKLQEVPVEAIIQAGLRAQRKLQPVPAAPGTGAGLNWGPTVDGKSLPRHAWDPTGPEYSATVPLMVGSVLNEFGNSIQAGDPSLDSMKAEEMRKRLSDQRGDKAAALLDVLQRKFPKASPVRVALSIHGHDRANERRQPGHAKGPAERGSRVRLLVSLADTGARRPAARLSLLGAPLRVREHRSLRRHDRRRRRCASARRQDGRRLDRLRSQRQSEPRRAAAMAGLLGRAVRDDDLRHDVCREEQS